jgi:hypothetical protein
MYYEHSSGVPTAQGSGLAALICLIVTLIGLVAVVWYAWRSGRRALRACPVCAAEAVRTSLAEELGGGLVTVRLQCGQCGTWRRGLATTRDVEVHERALERDRREIGRLVRRRSRREVEAFARVLQSEIVGADDFLSRARPTASRGRGRS